MTNHRLTAKTTLKKEGFLVIRIGKKSHVIRNMKDYDTVIAEKYREAKTITKKLTMI